MAILRSSEPFPPESATLRDGSRLTVRAIRPDDAPRLQAGMARLSPETIFRRFMVPLRSLNWITPNAGYRLLCGLLVAGMGRLAEA